MLMLINIYNIYKNIGVFFYYQTRQSQYRFWSALLGMTDPLPQHVTDTATPTQLDKLDLKMGENMIGK